MRLIRAQVRNYRVHDAIDVRFDQRTSLVGGGNETGKSTLVEAIHRALFLPAKGETQVHRGMRREGTSERPEVRLEFEHRGQEYELHKHFGGNSGYAVTLRCSGRPTLEGDEAEEHLAGITGTTLPKGKRPTDELLRMPWSHLWVWQGAAGDRPTDFIEGTTDELVRITAEGAGSVLMSELDGRLAARFRDAHTATFGAGTKALKGSALGQAEARVASCHQEVTELEALVAALADDADRYADARRRLAMDEPKALQVAAELDTLALRITTARRVEAERDSARTRFLGLRREADAMRKGASSLRQWDLDIAELTRKLAADERAAELADALEGALRREQTAAEALAAARADLTPIGVQLDRVETRARLLRAREQLRQAEIDTERLQKIDAEHAAIEHQIKALPEILAGVVDRLRAEDDELHKLRATLGAVTSTVNVLQARLPITLDGRPLVAREPTDLAATSVIRYGDEFALQLVVPGVADVDALRADIAQREAALKQRLAQFVIGDSVAASIDQLADVSPRRDALVAQQKTVRERLEAERPDRIRKALATAREGHIIAEAADRDAATPEDWPDPQALTDVDALALRYATARREQEETITALARAHEEARGAREAAAQHKAAWAQTRRADEDALKGAETLRDNLLGEHDGDAAAYLETLAALEEQEGKAERAASAAQQRLDESALDVLEERHARLIEQRKRLGEALEAARDQLSQARGRLHCKDGTDPDAALRDARERFDRARADCDRECLDAEATGLLRSLFQEEIDAANERVTQPLAEKIGEYLRRLYGPRAGVKVGYVDGRFAEFYLVRPGFAEYEEPFGTLSGGAREQVAAAVRLATAEILAADHGGTLPVVFDDAFVNTDPGRIESVIDMLYHAGERGLQVIVSTCDPDRYQNIGQVQWHVERGHGAREA